MVAPQSVVVEGKVSGYAFVRVTDPHGSVRTRPLASFLNDGALVWRRSPPGFNKSVIDVYAEHLATFMRSFYPTEAKVLALDRAKVHLSPSGLLTPLRANVHVVAEPSKMSHILQALDNPVAFGRYQPRVHREVRGMAFERHAARRSFTTIELMRSVSQEASAALTVEAVSSAFRRVGMWPLDPTVVSWPELCKGSDRPLAPETDVKRLTAFMVPSELKDMTRPVVDNGTLSTAGRATVLTSTDVLAELCALDHAKEERKVEVEAGKRARERRAAEKLEKDAEVARAKHAHNNVKVARLLRETWATVACEVASDAGWRMRARGVAPPSAAKIRRRLDADRTRPPPMTPREAWRVVSRNAAQTADRRLRARPVEREGEGIGLCGTLEGL